MQTVGGMAAQKPAISAALSPLFSNEVSASYAMALFCSSPDSDGVSGALCWCGGVGNGEILAPQPLPSTSQYFKYLRQY
jgi:hypothetical protein